MNLVGLGCSLTEHSNWFWHLSKITKWPGPNLGVSSSSNLLQVNRFHDAVLNKKLNSDSLIIWQITGIDRQTKRLTDVNNNIKTPFKRHYINSEPNIFDNKMRYDLLSHSPLISKKDSLNNCGLQDLQTTLATILMASKTYPLLVFVGWKDALTDSTGKNYLSELFSFFDKHSIHYIDDCYVEWTRNNNLPFWEDGWHPSEQAGIAFAENILHPAVRAKLLIQD